MRHVHLKPLQECSSLMVLELQPSWGIHLVQRCRPHGDGHYAAEWCCHWVYLDLCAWARSEALKCLRVTAYFMLLCNLLSRIKGPSVSPHPLWTASSPGSWFYNSRAVLLTVRLYTGVYQCVYWIRHINVPSTLPQQHNTWVSYQLTSCFFVVFHQ